MPRSAVHPRPMLRRPGWTSVDGDWQFALDPDGRWTNPSQVSWDSVIHLPFAPETPASGVGAAALFQSCWYRRSFPAPRLRAGERLLLHFGAVDYVATVWVNGEFAVRHEGGYTPFSADITDLVAGKGSPVIAVRAEDDPHDLSQPRGKQDWLAQPHAIWYPRTSGIWQTVWLERVPETHIDSLRWRPDLDRREIAFEACLAGPLPGGLRLQVRLSAGGRTLVDDVYSADGGAVARRIGIGTPPPDGRFEELVWGPSRPTIIEAEVRLLDGGGKVIDCVESYTALRSVGVDGGRFLLNGRPHRLRLVLDQGYWPESGYTPPDPGALRRDVELAKAMGFNGVRKHQKIEDPRYLYWADRLGLLVWEEMPAAYAFTPQAVQRLTREWAAAVQRDTSHPCIVAWVPFNESWGVPELPSSPEQRDYVRAAYHLTKAIDPSRPVIANDGWEAVATDILGVHDYEQDPQRLAQRYAGRTAAEVVARETPARRVLALAGAYNGQPLMLTECGGIGFAPGRPDAWGYSVAASAEELARRYRELMETVRALPLFAGFCYTQFADTYQETNGLLYADRAPKFPLAEIARATRGGTIRRR